MTISSNNSKMKKALFILLISMLSVSCGAQSKREAQTHATLNAALLKAAIFGDSEDVKSLLARGANVEARDQYKQTPLMLAADLNEVVVMRTLLAHGASINAIDREGNTALHHAADRGSVAAAKLLLDRGADYRIKNRYNYTPLRLTTRIESPSVDVHNIIPKLIRQRIAYDKRHHKEHKFAHKI